MRGTSCLLRLLPSHSPLSHCMCATCSCFQFPTGTTCFVTSGPLHMLFLLPKTLLQAPNLAYSHVVFKLQHRHTLSRARSPRPSQAKPASSVPVLPLVWPHPYSVPTLRLPLPLAGMLWEGRALPVLFISFPLCLAQNDGRLYSKSVGSEARSLSCVTLGKLLNHLAPQFPFRKMGMVTCITYLHCRVAMSIK